VFLHGHGQSREKTSRTGPAERAETIQRESTGTTRACSRPMARGVPGGAADGANQAAAPGGGVPGVRGAAALDGATPPRPASVAPRAWHHSRPVATAAILSSLLRHAICAASTTAHRGGASAGPDVCDRGCRQRPDRVSGARNHRRPLSRRPCSRKGGRVPGGRHPPVARRGSHPGRACRCAKVLVASQQEFHRCSSHTVVDHSAAGPGRLACCITYYVIWWHSAHDGDILHMVVTLSNTVAAFPDDAAPRQI
jgi:hypothetical protein